MPIARSKFSSRAVFRVGDQLLNTVLGHPVLLPPLLEVIRNCTDGRPDKVAALMSSVPDGYESLSSRVIASINHYFAYNSRVSVADRRGYLVTELYRRLAMPDCLLTCTAVRDAYFMSDNDTGALCGGHDVDLAWVQGDLGCLAECKVTLRTWLTSAGVIASEAEEKLRYLLCIQSAFTQEQVAVSLHLATLDTSFEYPEPVLKSYGRGFETIKLVGADYLYIALEQVGTSV